MLEWVLIMEWEMNGMCVTSRSHSADSAAVCVPVPGVHESLQHNLKKLNRRERERWGCIHKYKRPNSAHILLNSGGLY